MNNNNQPEPQVRNRASSIKSIIQHATSLPDSDHPFSGTNFDQTQLLSPPLSTSTPSSQPQKKNLTPLQSWEEESKGFWHDLRTMRWMRHPG